MKRQRVLNRLAVRRRQHDQMIEHMSPGAEKAFKRPGSLSGRK